jgi:RNA polymerase sigma-70 factor (ECF subfamily)
LRIRHQPISRLAMPRPAPSHRRMTRVSDERARWLARHVLPHEPALRAWLSTRRVADLDVDDIVQETYARLASAESVADVRNARTYAFQTAYSVIMSHLRRSRVVSIRAVADIDELGAVSDSPSPEEEAADRDELHRLAEAVAALPEKVREVFSLRRIEGLSQRQVAERLGLAESTVEKHMAKSFRLLMDRFGRGGKAPSRASRRGEVTVAKIDAQTD